MGLRALPALLAGLAAAQPPCPDGSAAKCPDGSRLRTAFPPCLGGPPVCADGSPAPRPGGGPGGGGGPPGGPQGNGNTHAAPLLGDVGFTTVGGTIPGTGQTVAAGEDIYGPFEAGFGQQQDMVLERIGCNPGSLGYVAGGIDTRTSEKMMAQQCSIELPRQESGGGRNWISLLDQCGGHTMEYHFHERMTCLYDGEAEGHSSQIGKANDGGLLYGKFEATGKLPQLDACGGHWGLTPESSEEEAYHYHVQDEAPFTFGCYGPNDDGSLVSVEECRAFYAGCDGNVQTLQTSDGPVDYDDWCPCFDARGSNTGRDVQELPAVAADPRRSGNRSKGGAGFLNRYKAAAAAAPAAGPGSHGFAAPLAVAAAALALLLAAAAALRARARRSPAPAAEHQPVESGDGSQLTSPTE